MQVLMGLVEGMRGPVKAIVVKKVLTDCPAQYETQVRSVATHVLLLPLLFHACHPCMRCWFAYIRQDYPFDVRRALVSRSRKVLRPWSPGPCLPACMYVTNSRMTQQRYTLAAACGGSEQGASVACQLAAARSQ